MNQQSIQILEKEKKMQRILIENKKNSIEGAVSSKIKLARANTQDRIVQLKEALIIADQLNIVDMQINATNQQSVIMSDDNLLNNNPLYLYGSKALRVEIETLLNRKSEESFVPGLRLLQQQAEALNKVKLLPGSVKVAQIDQEPSLEGRQLLMVLSPLKRK